MEPPENLVIRAATIADADAMGTIHVRAWQNAYRGVMPDAYLDGLQAEERAAMWRDRLGREDLPPVFVADLDGSVVGFAAFGRQPPSPDATSGGQLHVINIDPSYWGEGIGRALLRAATEALAELFDTAVLWVAPANARARSLYESEGWTDDGATATEELLGVVVTEMRYRRQL